MKYSLKHVFINNEGVVPQGSAEDRPLHGAPTYYYPLGRSLPDELRDAPRVAKKKSKSKTEKDTPEKSSLKQSRAWKSHYGLIDTEEFEKKQEKKKRWYRNEVAKKSTKLSLEVLRQDNTKGIETYLEATEKEHRKQRRIGPQNEEHEEHLQGNNIDSSKTLNEFAALSTAAIEGVNVNPDVWESDNSPRVSKKKIEHNKKFVKKLDVTKIVDKKGNEVYIDNLDPQYKRQISIFQDPENPIEWKEPAYLDGKGEHRISKLGYAKVADRKGDLKTDIYLYPYDPNWRRSADIVQQSVKHWIKNHGNPGAFPNPDSTMYLSIKEEWESLKNYLKETDNREFYYHGTNKEFKIGDEVLPPMATGNVAEKGRKKNLDKVFFTKDRKSAKIYADKAVRASGGEAHVYVVEPVGSVEWINKDPGTTVLMAPKALVVEEL